MASADEDLSAQCIRAEVTFGDNLLGAGSVRTTVQRSAPDAEASVRVQTTLPVNEPVVAVVVKTGCTSPFSRRYMLLADPGSEPLVASGAEAAAPGRTEAGRPLPNLPVEAAAPRRAPAATASGGVAATPRAPASRTDTALAAPDGRSRPASVVRKPEAPKAATPRLMLEPVDVNLAIERDPVLRLSLSLLSEPSTNEQERAAAAQLWKSLNATPEEILRDAQKLSVLEAEAKGLREQEARNRQSLELMQAELETSRYMTWAAYALGLLLLLALLALAWLWRRRESESRAPAAGKDWWSSAAAGAKAASVVRPQGTERTMSGTKSGGGLDLDLDIDSDLDELHGDAQTPPMAAADKRDFRASQMSVSRSVATEELFDVQQQSDFFVSLGEFDQAIGVLKAHLHESQEPSALAYLDLFKLYHRLDRRDEYEKLRQEFNQLFNAGAPPFDQYSDDSQGLEAYETAFGRIQALWPEPKVLDVIEKSIFRDPADTDTEVFDLEAYRELLLLHAIAKDMIKRDADELPSVPDFQRTAIRPLKAAASSATAGTAVTVMTAGVTERVTQPMDEIPLASPRLGLDVDLDALAEASAFEASLPEVEVPVEPTAKPAPPPGAAATPEEPVGNLIDFEVLDFMPPEEPKGE